MIEISFILPLKTMSTHRPFLHRSSLLLCTAMLFPGVLMAQDKVLNLYSARHYQTDESLYENFTKIGRAHV